MHPQEPSDMCQEDIRNPPGPSYLWPDPKDRFLRTHRSYIVSINKIERFSKREITLKGCSATIPIGRQYAENVYSKLTTRNITT